MPDDVKVLAGVGDDTVAPPIATDLVGGRHYQKVKFGWGVNDTWVETADTDGVRVPVGGAQLGTLTETAPSTDTASSGLNGRLQRVAQRLTSLIAQFPATLGAKTAATSLAVTLATDEPQLTLTGAVTEAAPASDTASSGLNGRLQRIAQRLTSLLGVVAASTATNAASGTADTQMIAATTSLRLMGFSAKEDAATPSTAEFVLRHGTSAAGTPLCWVTLGPDESVRDWFGPGGLIAASGIYLDRISGTTDVTVQTVVAA